MASDDFNRSNASPLDGSWSTSSSWANLRLVSNAVQTVTANNDSVAVHSTSTAADSQVTVSNVSGGGLGGPAIHLSTSAGDGYALLHNTGFLHIYVLPGFSDIGNYFLAPPIADGDVLRLRRVGSTLVASYNGTDVITTAADNTYTGGKPGIFIYDSTVVDDWTDNVAGGTPVGLATETDTALALISPLSAGRSDESDSAFRLDGQDRAVDGDLFIFGDTADDESAMGAMRVFGGFVASGSSGSTGLASETDSALTLAGLQLRATGLSSETDAALALTGAQIRAAGIATETDAALALAAVQIAATGRADETDSALGLSSGASGAVGRAHETDSALGLTAKQIAGAGRSDETDTAQALTGAAVRAVGLSGEADAAFALAAVQSLAAGRADEADSALALLAAGPLPVGLAVETDQAFALTSPVADSQAGHGAPSRRQRSDRLELADITPTAELVLHQNRLETERRIRAIIAVLAAAEIL